MARLPNFEKPERVAWAVGRAMADGNTQLLNELRNAWPDEDEKYALLLLALRTFLVEKEHREARRALLQHARGNNWLPLLVVFEGADGLMLKATFSQKYSAVGGVGLDMLDRGVISAEYANHMRLTSKGRWLLKKLKAASNPP